MKRFKMVLYGEPGVGKSVFASKAPKPFFITSDGNYEWLEDFGADPNAHVEVSSWAAAKKAFSADYSNYETIVIDLVEDLFKWCEYEYCQKNHIDHISDHGYGKGYDATRNEFFVEMCKLISLDKNIIFIMHGMTITTKDRRGVEHVKHVPTNRLPDKVIDMIEGRVRYFLRCYLKAEDDGTGMLIKKRYLSLVPKENEFGIIRGVDETKIPQDIPLDFNVFAKTIGLDTSSDTTQNVFVQNVQVKHRRKRVEEDMTQPEQMQIPTDEMKPMEENVVSTNETIDVDVSKVDNKIEESDVKQIVNDTKNHFENVAKDAIKKLDELSTKESASKPELIPTPTTENIQKEDKLAAIKARLAARKAANGGN